MLVNIHHDSKREHNRLLVAGIAFLTTIGLLLWLSVAIYNKEFDRVTFITVKADRAGLQLAKFGDVRVNGALVGHVREIGQDGEQAEIRIALEPDAAETIPNNVTVEIIPTTLFGQKFVSLVQPATPSGTSLQDGDVITADRVRTTVELSRVLADLFPLLRSVRPADLNATLNALATALQGRGEQLGETMDQLGGYVEAIDEHLPTLRQDLIELAEVADAYDVAAPDLLDTLDNITVTSKTITQKKRDLDTFFSDIGGVADVATRVLGDNEQNLIRMGQITEPVMALLAEYSPEFPCLIQGAARYAPILSKTFEGNVVKQYIEILGPQYRVFDERDAPVYGEVGHGPWCRGLPNFKVPADPTPLDQGWALDENPPDYNIPNLGLFDPISADGGVGSGFGGTEGEQQIVNAMLAAQSGKQPTTYGAFGSLLYGPLVRQGQPVNGAGVSG